MKSWKWETPDPSDLVPGAEGAVAILRDARGRNRCTVWKNGTWHTWNENGVGGENDTAMNWRAAKEEATMAVIRQGWARLVTEKGTP